MGIIIKAMIVTATVVAAIALGEWVIRQLADEAASELVIKVWSSMTSFVIVVFVYSIFKNDLYGWFYSRPESYETQVQAAHNGMMLVGLLLMAFGAAIYLVLTDDGLKRRSKEVRRRRREARCRRRQGGYGRQI